MAKRHQRHAAPTRQTRTRTRQNKGAPLVTDPIKNTQLLNDQLRALGLYAAPTLGDGNCLFRALSDQYYGTPSQHFKLREEICNWMEAHKERYAPFVDDDRGLDVHLGCMRQPGTYGGHLELTAFSHLKKRDVKVIQPGLVYVIEWQSGADLSPTRETAPETFETQHSEAPIVAPLKDREARRLRREKVRDMKEKTAKSRQHAGDSGDESDDDLPGSGTVYVAYHDWEHFSSVRNLTGPHTGIPYVVEKPVTTSQAAAVTKKQLSRADTPSSESSLESLSSEIPLEADIIPVEVPLPPSRSASPPPSSETSNSASSNLSVPPVPGYNCSGDDLPRVKRSPKRALPDSYLNAEDSQGEAKRSRSNLRPQNKMDIDPDADTPSLLASGSSADSSSSSSPSPAPTPPPSMVVIPPTPVTPSKPLTRRQRKVLGLPKPRANLASQGRSGSAGKIVVPGGKFKKDGSDADTALADVEWAKNGRGRVDVRGFRELKI